MQTRELIAADRRRSCSGPRAVLAVRREIVIVGEAGDGQEAVCLVATPCRSSHARQGSCWGRSWAVGLDDLASRGKKKEVDWCEEWSSAARWILYDGEVALSWGEVETKHPSHSISEALLDSLYSIHVDRSLQPRVDTSLGMEV